MEHESDGNTNCNWCSTVTKGLLKGLEDLEKRGQVETIQPIALLRSVRILRRLEETCCYSNSSEKPLANACVKKKTLKIMSECRKLAQKEYKTRHDWLGKVIHGEMCKKFKFNHTNKWYMHNPAPVLENNTHKLLWDFDIHTNHLISARRPDLIIINKKKRTCKIVYFAVPAYDRIKLKECEKKDKYLDLARELKTLWNMPVTIIPIVIGAFGTVTKGLLTGQEDSEVGGRVETIQTTTLLRTARILWRILETWGDLLSLRLQWKTISVR